MATGNRKNTIDPVTVEFAKENCKSIEIHCHRCAHVKTIGFDGLSDTDLVIELPRTRGWSCERCGCQVIEARPRYPDFGGRTSGWLGLTKDS
jgi:hypothetical protein